VSARARKASPLRPDPAWKMGYRVPPPSVAALAFGRPSGTEPIGAPRVIVYAEIHPDGSEYQRTGQVWCVCEYARKGARTQSGFWVRATHDEQFYAVLRADRRTQAGRVRGARYRPGRGRVVEMGEWFTERHPDAPSGGMTQAARTRVRLPSVIKVEPLPAHVMSMLSSPPNGRSDAP
jgi:hypothetical protein